MSAALSITTRESSSKRIRSGIASGTRVVGRGSGGSASIQSPGWTRRLAAAGSPLSRTRSARIPALGLGAGGAGQGGQSRVEALARLGLSHQVARRHPRPSN